MNSVATRTGLIEDADPTSAEFTPGTRLYDGQFTITRSVRSDGSFRIYGAKDAMGRDVFLKFPLDHAPSPGPLADDQTEVDLEDAPARQPGFVLQEAHCLTCLDHPNILSFNEACEKTVGGRALTSLLDRLGDGRKRLKPEEIVSLGRTVLSAIQSIHDHGCLHGDVSAQNILLSETGEAFLIDYGTARLMSLDGLRRDGSQQDGAESESDADQPENLFRPDADYGPSLDLYAFAATLHDTVLGGVDAEDATLVPFGARADRNRPIPLAGRFKGYPSGFLETIDRALEAQPADRYQSAAEWLEALDRLLSDKESIMKLLGKTIGLRRTGQTAGPSAASASVDVAEEALPEVVADVQPDVSTETKPKKTPNPKLVLERKIMSIDLSGLKEIGGFIAGCLVDFETGLMLASVTAGKFDIETAAAANVEVVRGKQNAMRALGLNDHIEDILITLGTQVHLIRPLEKMPTLFIYAALDRKSANLGMARLQVKKVEQSIAV